ncbi:DUF1345 domain-containing protein [Paracoccus sp. (in: a-proteobacteria)]|uniref:DUF1345 domain-containing protein n=1 Tax=Paracoccus sp. TaxID=267 RepID=UPI0039E3288F
MRPSLKRHLRFLLALAFGLVAAALAWPMPAPDRLLLFADVLCLSYLAMVGVMLNHVPPPDLQRHAGEDDEGARLIVLIAVGVVLVSLSAILLTLRDKSGGSVLRSGLALASVPLGWAMIHMVMAFHYAHKWYRPGGGPQPAEARGLDFPGLERDALPGLWDFVYYSFTLGMTAQTSDVAVTRTDFRRVTILHSALSFFYNTVLLALAVNAGVSLGQ